MIIDVKDWKKCKERELQLFETLDTIGKDFRTAYMAQENQEDSQKLFLKLFGEATDKLDNLNKLCKAFLEKNKY